MATIRIWLHVPLLLACGALMISCANQLPPEGGPVDKSPPAIISTYPDPYTLHFKGKRLNLEFDKYVDHRSVEESIFISPHLGELDFDWSGKEVEITFNDDLRKNTTYVVSVGTDVKDLRSPPNRMAQAYTFAFSTGADIDRGGIRGKIYPIKSSNPSEGIMIFAYQLGSMNPDTLNPRTSKPDYITQTGTNGKFYLQHLAFGKYRIFAVKDEYRNLLYDPQIDEFGITSHDILLGVEDTLQDNVLMQMAKEDTTAPRLVKIDPRDVHHLSVELSESIDTTLSPPLALSIIDTLSKDQLKIFSVYPSQSSLPYFTVVTDKQDSTKGYRLTIDRASDLASNQIDQKANTLIFTGSDIADTSVTKVQSTSIPDSSSGVVLNPTIQIQFSDAVQRQSFANAIALTDTSGSGVPSSVDWLSDIICRVRPQGSLSSKTVYRVSIRMENGLDWSGKKFQDSLRVIRFETLDAEALSSIEGIVVDTREIEKEAAIIVTAEGVDAKNKKSYTTSADRNGSFLIGQIEEGRYVVHAFKDRNLNGKYDAGSPFPFVGSERFGYAPDTLKVRARWPLEGVKIELR